MRCIPQSSYSKTPPPISKTVLRAASQQYEFQRADVSLGVSHKLNWGEGVHSRLLRSVEWWSGHLGGHIVASNIQEDVASTEQVGEDRRAQWHYLSKSTLQKPASVDTVVKQWSPKMRLTGVICLKINSSLAMMLNRDGELTLLLAELCDFKQISLSEPQFLCCKIGMATAPSSVGWLWGLQNNACK